MLSGECTARAALRAAAEACVRQKNAPTKGDETVTSGPSPPLRATATVAALAIIACSPTPGAAPARPAESAPPRVPTWTPRRTPSRVPSGYPRTSVDHLSGRIGWAAPASLVASGCTIVEKSTDSTTASLSEAARQRRSFRARRCLVHGCEQQSHLPQVVASSTRQGSRPPTWLATRRPA